MHPWDGGKPSGISLSHPEALPRLPSLGPGPGLIFRPRNILWGPDKDLPAPVHTQEGNRWCGHVPLFSALRLLEQLYASTQPSKNLDLHTCPIRNLEDFGSCTYPHVPTGPAAASDTAFQRRRYFMLLCSHRDRFIECSNLELSSRSGDRKSVV